MLLFQSHLKKLQNQGATREKPQTTDSFNIELTGIISLVDYMLNQELASLLSVASHS